MTLAEQCISLKTHRKTEVRIILGWHKDPDGYFVCEKNPEDFERFEAAFPRKEKQKLPEQLF